jgi:hypothetical protein
VRARAPFPSVSAAEKRIDTSQTFSETILSMDAPRAIPASIFHQSMKLTESSLVLNGTLCEMRLRSAALY